jgi:hypothetical protein
MQSRNELLERRRDMNTNENLDKKKRKVFMLIALGISLLLLWLSFFFFSYYLLSPINVYATGTLPPWYLPFILAVDSLRIINPWTLLPAVGLTLIFIGLFRLVRLLLRSKS